jgi:hypothetical protein
MLAEIITPFLPLAFTVIGSLVFSLLVKQIFVYMLNRRITREYRYTGANPKTQSSRKQAKRVHDDASEKGGVNSETVFTQQDSLSIYRSLLGLGQPFTGEELKAAYRSSAAKYHPDRYASASRKERDNAEDLMKKVNEAYEILKAAAD